MDQQISELLEEEERKANRLKAAKAFYNDPKRNDAAGPESPRRDVDERSGYKRDLPGSSSLPIKYSAEREENDARRSRRSHDSVEGEDDRGSANGSVRSRSKKCRSRSPEPRSSTRDHATYRDRDSDSYRPGRRSNDDRSDDARNRYYRPGHGSSRPRVDDNSDRGYSSRRSDHRERRDPRDRRDERRSSYGGDSDRRRSDRTNGTTDEVDRRMVFVQQLAQRLSERKLHQFFEQAGPVHQVQIVKDKMSQRSKGIGYVEFEEQESVQKAMDLTGQKLAGLPIIVSLTDAEKNRQPRATEGQPTQSNGIPFHRLYVGNIHFSITEEDLKTIFEPFGDLETVSLQKDDTGRSRGYGFVQYVNPNQAKDALEKMNGFVLAGRPIRVGLGNDRFTTESTNLMMQQFKSTSSQAAESRSQGSQFSGMGGRGAHAGGTANFDRASGRDMGNASALDDNDVNFANYSRDALMRKLARVDEPDEKTPNASASKGRPAPVEQPVVTRCVLLKYLYKQAEETDPHWQDDLVNDVRTECAEKYGPVVHISLALDNDDGEVYVKFADLKGGDAAIKGLNGRLFAGRTITAQFVVDAVYNAMFPAAQKV